MELKISNLDKPSNKKFKFIADVALFALLGYLPLIMALPLPEDFKLWANFGVSFIVITLKAITKFTTDEVV